MDPKDERENQLPEADNERPCECFTYKDPKEAYLHIWSKRLKQVLNYGRKQYGHYLHTWDDGERFLARCGACGGYILVQASEFHGIDVDDSYYTDFFPVSSPGEADELNRKYDGFTIEFEFGKRYLMETNGSLRWSR